VLAPALATVLAPEPLALTTQPLATRPLVAPDVLTSIVPDVPPLTVPVLTLTLATPEDPPLLGPELPTGIVPELLPLAAPVPVLLPVPALLPL